MQHKFSSALILSVTLCLLSCSGNSNSVEGKIKQYFKDSVTPKLDDPSSLELVSIGKPDTITNHTPLQSELDFDKEYYESVQKLVQIHLDGGDSAVGSLRRDEYLNAKNKADSLKTSIESLKNELAKPSHMIGFESKVTFRAKNKMGALVLNNINIEYYPSNEADNTPEHFFASLEK